ncbi:MAG: Rho-binding antiterminator [Acidithiobacillus sp.]
MASSYVPVSCALHSAIELAILQKRSIQLQLVDGSVMSGQILDVWTAKGREWLRIRQSGQEKDLDLTLIHQLQENISNES